MITRSDFSAFVMR